MYTNIPTRELINIIKDILDRNNNTSEKTEARNNDTHTHNCKPELLAI
jgi:hypothetical protein